MTRLCNEVKISPQAFYKKRRKRQSQEIDRTQLMSEVFAMRQLHPRMGGRKIWKRLKGTDMEIGRDRLFRFLRRESLLVPPAPRKARTTDSRHCLPTFNNLIAELEPTRRNEVWVSDLTYIRINGGFVYLALIMDLYSRKIVGWNCGNTLEAQGCINALQMAYRSLKPGEAPIHHSDRGCQYCCHAYVEKLRGRGLQISMTEINHCYENAHAERLNGILKQEYALGGTFRNQAQANRTVAQAVKLYNLDRPHCSLNYATPQEVYDAAA